MNRGSQIASKVIEVISHILAEENISEGVTFDSEILTSATPPFIDKLMMFQASLLSSSSIGYYGSALGMSARRDLGAAYTRLLSEAIHYAEDGINIMIEHGWLEEPPRSVDNMEVAVKEKV